MRWPLRRSLVPLVILVLALLTAACGEEARPTPSPTAATPSPVATFPVTITDSLGRQVNIPAPPQRIVSLSPRDTEILFALGLGPWVVAVDNLSDYPPEVEAKPRVGSAFTGLNVEAIAAQRPDLIISPPTRVVPSSLEPLGVPILALDEPKDIEGTYQLIRTIGRATGRVKEAEDVVARMRKGFEEIERKVMEARLPRPKVFFEIDGTDPGRPWTAGPGSFIDSLISLAGGDNVAGKGPSAYFQMSTEEIVRQAPDIIILGDAEFVSAKEVAMRPGWKDIPAVQKGAIYPIDADLVSRAGPRLVEGARAIAAILHPQLFQER
ncbi:MAG: ABC transporter substrate-binding protein [Dehalococcoidia bacterium]|nr:ABC transporter substrate-binding protein [Dehalococcoidia bacterium]